MIRRLRHYVGNTKHMLGLELTMWRMALLKAIPGFAGCRVRNALLPYRHGRCVMIWDGVQIERPALLRLGDHVSINRGSLIHAGGGIEVGSHVLIGPGVILYSQNHRYRCPGVPFDSQGYDYAPVKIGDNVWIAANAIVLPGVTIGDNVVVAAGAVVTKDVVAGSVVAGNPARPIRELDAGAGTGGASAERLRAGRRRRAHL